MNQYGNIVIGSDGEDIGKVDRHRQANRRWLEQYSRAPKYECVRQVLWILQVRLLIYTVRGFRMSGQPQLANGLEVRPGARVLRSDWKVALS